MAVATLANIHKHYKGMSTPALDGINLSIDPGNIVVLVGPNGSGKTTAMEILSGLRTADSGSATINDRVVVPGGRHRFDIGVQLQEAGLPQRLKVKEAVRSISSLYRDPGPVDSILKSLGLSERMNQMIDRLSGGWQRRLDIALACIGQPRLPILDEPTSGLDPSARADLWEFLRDLRSRGMSVLASTHDLSEAEAFADRIIVLHNGKIILDGHVAEVLAVAGGTWRLRLTGVAPGTAKFLEMFGVRPLPQGENISIVGEREELTQMAVRIEAERAAGKISYIDLLSGPVRLEDVYAFAATTTKNGSAQNRNHHDG